VQEISRSGQTLATLFTKGESALRLVLAIKVFFAVLFNARTAELVREACARAKAGQPAPKAAAPTKPEGKAKAAATEVKAPDLGPVAAVLSLLQREARFVDFLMEDVDAYGDAQVGAAARSVHRGCRKALQDYVKLQPVRLEKEGDRLTVDPGFDPAAIRLTGNLVGNPPFQGTLRHHGWRIEKANLPAPPQGPDPGIVQPAEVEIQ